MTLSPHNNSAELAARWRKVARMLAALAAHEFDFRSLDRITADGWRTVALAAGVHEPSAETIALLLQTVTEVASSTCNPTSY